jgi:hypothetical protein
MDSGQAQIYPDDLVTIDGKPHIYNTLKTPLKDNLGNVWGVLAFGRDVTERERQQELTSQRAAELATVAEVSTIMTTIMDPDELLQQVVDMTKERFDYAG